MIRRPSMWAFSMSSLLHMLNEIGRPEYFRPTRDICIFLGMPVNNEISKDHQMSTAGDKGVNKLRISQKKSPAFRPDIEVNWSGLKTRMFFKLQRIPNEYAKFPTCLLSGICMMEWTGHRCHITDNPLIWNAACQICFRNKKALKPTFPMTSTISSHLLRNWLKIY